MVTKKSRKTASMNVFSSVLNCYAIDYSEVKLSGMANKTVLFLVFLMTNGCTLFSVIQCYNVQRPTRCAGKQELSALIDSNDNIIQATGEVETATNKVPTISTTTSKPSNLYESSHLNIQQVDDEKHIEKETEKALGGFQVPSIHHIVHVPTICPPGQNKDYQGKCRNKFGSENPKGGMIVGASIIGSPCIQGFKLDKNENCRKIWGSNTL